MKAGCSEEVHKDADNWSSKTIYNEWCTYNECNKFNSEFDQLAQLPDIRLDKDFHMDLFNIKQGIISEKDTSAAPATAPAPAPTPTPAPAAPDTPAAEPEKDHTPPPKPEHEEKLCVVGNALVTGSGCKYFMHVTLIPFFSPSTTTISHYENKWLFVRDWIYYCDNMCFSLYSGKWQAHIKIKWNGDQTPENW